jgi:sugar/nucleoside kinase (ribokinase family)
MFPGGSIRPPQRGITMTANAADANADRGATAAAPSTSSSPHLPHQQNNPVVVGCGSCGVDYLAAVAAFPKPDEKLRTETLESQGGGNAANALTAAARLGLRTRLVSKVGGDGLAEGISAELRRDGVDDTHVLRASTGVASPFTYIIVDRQGGTRTCIHTPLSEPLKPEELSPSLVEAALTVQEEEGDAANANKAAVVYFDGRMADAAIRLAQAARKKGIPVLVEGERPRPGLDDLLAQADVVCTSAHFPKEWTGKKTTGEALAALARRLPRAKVLVTTLGAQGAVMLVREEGERAALLPPRTPPATGREGDEVAFLPGSGPSASSSTPQSLDDLIERLKTLANAETGRSKGARDPSNAASCVASVDGQPVRVAASVVAATPTPVSLLAPGMSLEEACAAAESAARAAAMNADAANARAYGDNSGGSEEDDAGGAAAAAPVVRATVLFAPAALLPSPEAVVDTTGAGDAFIGSIVYALAKGLPAHRALRLAGVVAAAKCTALGARPGLPLSRSVDVGLLG